MKRVIGILVIGIFISVASAQASMKEVKTYKEAFPEEKPKCAACHKDAMPKKDDGAHELNEYGAAVMAEAGKAAAAEIIPTADNYKAVGKIEDFKK